MAITLNEGTYQRKRFDVPAMSLYTLDFGSEQPNYFRVNNMSDVTLYGATNSLPNKNLYDFKINPTSVANFAEPKHSSKLYIFNPHDKDAQCIINYWSGEFDATFMAVSEISLNNEGVVETDGIVKGFTTSLPAGTNKIGTVTIENLNALHNNVVSLLNRNTEIKDINTSIKTQLECIYTAMDAITESNSEIAGRNYTKVLSDILTALQNSCGGSGDNSQVLNNILSSIGADADLSTVNGKLWTLLQNSDAITNTFMATTAQEITTIYTAMNTIATPCTKFYVEENTDAEQMYTFNKINMFVNDGESDIVCTISGTRFVIKPGETLRDMILSNNNNKTVKIPKNSSYRIIGG